MTRADIVERIQASTNFSKNDSFDMLEFVVCNDGHP